MSEKRINAKDVYAGAGITSLAIGARALYKLVDSLDTSKEPSIAKTTASFLTAIWVGTYSYSQIKRINEPGIYSLDRMGPYYPKPNDPLQEKHGQITTEPEALAAATIEVIDITPEPQSNQLAA